MMGRAGAWTRWLNNTLANLREEEDMLSISSSEGMSSTSDRVGQG